MRQAVSCLPSKWLPPAVFSFATLLLLAGAASAAAPVAFDTQWNFFYGDPKGAESPDFDDPYWAIVNLPHDWSIGGPFDRKNPTGAAGGFLPGGVGWYRKHFVLPGQYGGQRLFLQFDGVMAKSDVWVNGFHMGRQIDGTASTRYELTPYLHKNGREVNVVAVRVDGTAQPASRGYSGAGIYRHVWLTITNAVFLEPGHTTVTTPRVSAAEAAVHVTGTITNQSDAARDTGLRVSIVGPDGKAVQTSYTKGPKVAAGDSADFERDLAVPSPQLWDPGHPALYRMTVSVLDGGATLDEETTPFGIREFHFDRRAGFRLNGRNEKIKGVELRQDAGALGIAVPSGVWERRLALLKEFGVNAIRTARTASPELLDLCDRMGLLVMEEMSKADAADTGTRDRNHPAVVLYSAGNEIRIAGGDTKPLTPTLIGTAVGDDLKTWLAHRDNAANAGQFLRNAFDYLGGSAGWPAVGVDTGLFDRTGRPRPKAFERQSWWSAEPMVYIARREDANPSRLVSDWTPANAGPQHLETVEVYSNCELVDLLLNGKSLGSKTRPGNDSPRIWRVPFEPGTLQAVGTNKGETAARYELRTAGKAARVAFVADRENVAFRFDDLVYVTATVVDDNGIPVSGASDKITFSGRGPAFIAAIDNGDPAWHESFQSAECKALDGRCVAILKANSASGKLVFSAAAPGLRESTVEINVVGR
jgi:beta-galactosidase